ncbi:ATPase family associated with various cellular activities (AAA) [seawater metagenome]|uniref:ATPase family associated with various cellular activities (AAA) n=1 Tax=seawater metagenome TaxID=1561972 RepID=A0A5E8CME2_9ZZZZ
MSDNNNKRNNDSNEENPNRKRIKFVRYDSFDDFLKSILNEEISKLPPQKNPQLISDDSDSDSESNSESESESEKEYEHIDRKVNKLQDLIDLGKMYDPKKRYNIDMKTLNKLVNPLEELHKMIGMTSVKENIVDHIIFYLQKLDNDGLNDMLHTVIQGPPGVGKTELGKILSKIYLGMGILKNDKFRVAKRADLIGKYLGHTAVQTQKVIDSCKGGVLFIDEAYSLGNPEGRDMFSKECLDTINQNLTENKSQFLCIIAGYKESLDSCFFSYNEGLSRRFSIRYTIEPYIGKELKEIFIKIVKQNNWEITDDIDSNFFEKNIASFKFYGGDMETLFFCTKVVHARRVFCMDNDKKKVITNEDIINAYEIYKKNRGEKNENRNEAWRNLYI